MPNPHLMLVMLGTSMGLLKPTTDVMFTVPGTRLMLIQLGTDALHSKDSKNIIIYSLTLYDTDT